MVLTFCEGLNTMPGMKPPPPPILTFFQVYVWGDTAWTKPKAAAERAVRILNSNMAEQEGLMVRREVSLMFYRPLGTAHFHPIALIPIIQR